MTAILPSLLLLGSAFASEASGAVEVPWRSLGLHALNLAILVAVLAWFTRSAIKDALLNRTGAIKQHLADSNRMRREAQARYDDIVARLDRFGQELEQLRRQARTEAEAEAAAIAERVDQEVAQVRQAAERAIDHELAVARAELHAHASRLAIRHAGSRISEQLTGEDTERLHHEFRQAVAGEGAGDG